MDNQNQNFNNQQQFVQIYPDQGYNNPNQINMNYYNGNGLTNQNQQYPQQQQQWQVNNMMNPGNDQKSGTPANFMMQPAMPNQNMQNQQYNVLMQQAQFANILSGGMGGLPFQQDPTQQLLQLDLNSRLQASSVFQISTKKYAGCNDMICCAQLPNQTSIKMSSLSASEAYKVDMNEPECCAHNFKGKIVGHIYDQNGAIYQTDDMFNVTHNRSGCIFKFMFGWLYVFGICLFYIFTLICKASTKMKEGEQTLYNIKHGCCYASNTIEDSNGKIKYTLESSGLQLVLKDQSGTEVTGFNFLANGWIRSGKSSKISAFQLTFPANFDPKDKMAVILALSRRF